MLELCGENAGSGTTEVPAQQRSGLANVGTNRHPLPCGRIVGSVVPRIREWGDVAYITLTKGYVAVIDSADVPLVANYSWIAKEDKTTVYARAYSRGKLVSLSELLIGHMDGMDVDHEDRNGLNNRRCNLRHVTRQQNLWNRRIVKNNTSGYRGVTWSKKRNKWRADIKQDGRQIVLGYFIEKEDAARAFDAAAIKYRGEHANLNFP